MTAAEQAWERAYFRSLPIWQHQIVTGTRPGLFACFNEADLLISDVSSVVSDYLASGKPYAVVNTSGLPDGEFRAQFPTVRAGTLLGPAAEGVPALLASVCDPARDTLVEARRTLRVHLLGPDEPPPMERFNRAAQRLVDAAEARNARVAERIETSG